VHRDLLGLLDRLLHVVMLLFSGISTEDGKLVELDAVHELNSGMHTNTLVCLAIHADPGILCVHLVENPIPLHLCLANDEAMEQLISLLGLCDSEVLIGLESFLEFVELLFLCFFLSHGLVIREVEERVHLLPNCN
jgi:hypothetical protein